MIIDFARSYFCFDSNARQNYNDDELSQGSSYDPDDVYSVKIIKIFIGEENITALPGIRTVGVRSPSLIVDFHSPAKWLSDCIPKSP